MLVAGLCCQWSGVRRDVPVASAAGGGRLGWAGAGGGFERWRSDAICLSNRLEGKARAPERGMGGEEREAVGTRLGEGRGGFVGGMGYVWIG